MRNDEYWGRRAAQRMFEHMQSAEETADQIAQLYFRSSRYLSSQMEEIFERYKTKHGLTDAEARRMLNMLQGKKDIEELLRQLRNGSPDKSREELIRLLEAPAYRVRIERLQQLQAQIDQVMQQVYQQEKAVSTAHYIDLANESYCRSMFDIQQRAGVGFSFAQVDRKQIDQVVGSKWSGRNYSSRIWNNTKVLAQDLKEELLINLVTGRTEHEVAQALADKFARGASVARRLVRTESCFISNQMEMKSYEAAGIKRYRYLATLDLRTSKICASLDGKLFLVSEQQPGKNCPPMHPWCRSTTVAEITGDDMACMERIARDPVTGKTYTVPASMTYQEWYAKYVEGSQEEEEKKTVAKDSGAGIINPGIAKEVEDVHTVGKINKEIYKCITDDIVTDEVVITDNQIQHMKGRHPEAWEKALNNLKSALQAPDYIIADEKHKNTGLIVKEINSKAEHAQIVLRICTSEDPEGYKNSIISCWKISEKRLRNYLKNKRVLYKKE